jgi:hypothetical protein
MSEFTGTFPREAAADNEISQLLPSGCGVTALVNVCTVLNAIDKCDIHLLDTTACILRKRANEAPLPQYLQSRSVAGCTGEDLVQSMELLVASNSTTLNRRIIGKFWTTHDIETSECRPSISVFLRGLIHEGCCAVATLNLQLFGNDAWHHQMVYGVESDGSSGDSRIHMMNPVCCYPESVVQKLISTPSVLLVRRDDVISRLDWPVVDDSIYDSELWRSFNVREQIRAVTQSLGTGGGPSHVVIPANYVGGIAVFQVAP